MSEEEKEANELIEKYYNLLKGVMGAFTKSFVMDEAKQCALVCVDKMLDNYNEDCDFEMMDYYKKVKEIITNK